MSVIQKLLCQDLLDSVQGTREQEASGSGEEFCGGIYQLLVGAGCQRVNIGQLVQKCQYRSRNVLNIALDNAIIGIHVSQGPVQ